MTSIPFSVQPIIGYGVQVALFDLHSDCFSGQSLGLVGSNTEGRGIDLPFSSLDGIPRHRKKEKVTSYQSSDVLDSILSSL